MVGIEQPSIVGRVLRASTRGFTCGTQSNKIGTNHDFGALVKASVANNDQIQVMGLIYSVEVKDDQLVNELVMADAVNSNILRDQRENRMVPVEISVLNVGYGVNGQVFQSLPPRPPMSLSDVSLCTRDEVFTFIQKLDYFRLVLNASEVPADNLLAETLRYSAWMLYHDDRPGYREYMVRCGRELARQLSHDLKRLEHMLALIRP